MTDMNFKEIIELLRKGKLNKKDIPVDFAKKVNHIMENKTPLHLMSQKSLKKDWLSKEEDLAWEHL